MSMDHASSSRGASSPLPNATQTRLHGYWLILARATCVIIAVLTVGTYIANIPTRFDSIGRFASAHHAGLVQFGFFDYYFAFYFVTFDLACMVVFSLTAIVIFWRKSDDWMAMFVCLTLVTYGAVGTFVLYALDQFQPLESLPMTLVQALGLGSAIIFYYLFPNGRFIPRWTAVLAIVYAVWAFTWLISPATNPLNLPFLLTYVIQVVFFGSGVVAQLYRYRRFSNAVERQQTKWVVFGATITTVGLVGFNLFRLLFASALSQTLIGLVWIPFSVFCQLFVPVTIGIAILGYRLWEVDPIINRVLVYGTLTGILALVYFGSIIGLQFLLHGLTGGNQLASVGSTLAIAALFQPFRHYIQRIIDRRFYRRKYDAAKTLEAFSATLRNEVDLTALSEQLVAVVQETMQPAHISLWLRKSEHGRERNPNGGLSAPTAPSDGE